MQHTIHAIIRPGNESGFVAECPQLQAVTQGADLDEVVANLREVVGLALEGEDMADLGFTARPVILVSMELEPAIALGCADSPEMKCLPFSGSSALK